MSKYNLIDIYEQYQIGSGWTNDFDYEGMLNAGLKTGVDNDIELLKKLAEDYTDVNYHREAAHLYDAIEALEEGAIKEASMFFGDFHAEIKATMETFDMDIEPTLGKFMASKMEENTEAVDLAIEASQEKAGINEDKYDDIVDADDDIPADKKKAAAAAYRKVDKGASYEKATSHIKEVSSREGSRMEGLVDQRLKAKFLDIFADLYFDLTDEDPFQAEDVVDYLGIEMLKHLDNIQAQGDRLAGLDQQEFTAIDEEDSIEEGGAAMLGPFEFLKSKGVDEEIILAFLKVHAKDIVGASKDEIMDEFEEFRSVNYDYIDENLKEHFGRFMKDYQ